MTTSPQSRKPKKVGVATFVIAIAAMLASAAASAQSPFYAGKQIRLVVGAAAGGGNDIYARILARYMPAHISGRPAMIVENMPGASSITAANYIQHIAPRDGTAMLAIVQALPMSQAFGQDSVNFDLAAFKWIGNMTDSPVVFVASKASGVATLADAKAHDVLYGSTTSASLFGMMPIVVNNLIGARFHVINGYDSGKAIELATERGEIAGFGGSTWSSLTIDEPGWIEKRTINVLAQAGLRKAPGLDGVPLLTELAHNDLDRQVLNFYSGVVAYARAFAVGPDAPDERVAELRAAFDATMTDPDFLAEAAKIKLDVTPISGQALQNVIAATVHADKALLTRAQSALADAGFATSR